MPLPLEELFAMLPLGYQAQAFRWLVLSTAIVYVFRKFVIPLLAWASDFTAAKWDNVLVLKLSNGLDAAATWLDTALRLAPRIASGPSPAKEPITTRTSRRPPPALMAPPPIGAPPPVIEPPQPGDRTTLPDLADNEARARGLEQAIADTGFNDPGEITKSERISAKASQRPQEPGSAPGGGAGTPGGLGTLSRPAGGPQS